jgi:hypothetical protein
MQTARRKAIYETLHPQTKAFVAGAYGSNAAQGKFVANVATASFADGLADRTGIAARSIRRDAERGGRIVGPALSRVSGTRLDNGRFLDELKHVPPGGQVAYVEEQLAREARPRVASATKVASPATNGSEPEDELFPRFLAVADQIESLDLEALIASSGHQRAVLGQRAASAAERLNAIVEGIRR